MWEAIERPKTVKATKALVKEFYEMTKIHRERPLSITRLGVYREILKRGEFRPVTWASAYCNETGGTYRVNGQHTSTILYELIEGALPDFFVTVERYQCDTVEDVARLYATFDSASASRSSNDIINSFASTVKEFAGLKKKTFALSVNAASFFKWGLGYHSHPPPERAELLLQNIDFTCWLDSILWESDDEVNQRDTKHIIRAAVAAAMLSTYSKSKSKADEFWKLVRNETADRKDATRVLAAYLIRSAARTNMKIRGGKEVVTFKEMYSKCITAWNAWRDDRPTDLKYYADKPVPTAK